MEASDAAEEDAVLGPLTLSVVLYVPDTFRRSTSPRKKTGPRSSRYCFRKPDKMLLTHTISYWWHPGAKDSEPEREVERERRSSQRANEEAWKRSLEYGVIRTTLVQEALARLEKAESGSIAAQRLQAGSAEAEAVISMYLLSLKGGERAPGVGAREALGGIIVQRLQNEPLYKAFAGQGKDEGVAGGIGSPRTFVEHVVWHGVRLKSHDGTGSSLAAKLRSITESGFDPQRCRKGAAAEGGIWLSTSPLAAFGQGGNCLAAFILCIAKIHLNEWVDGACARVLQTERVLPLYTLVHTS